MTEKVSSKDISAAALKVFSAEELESMPKPSLSSLGTLLARRLAQRPEPTLEELQGIKELVVEHLWHPALGTSSELSQSSTTPSSETSD
jgi:hypothetical protein